MAQKNNARLIDPALLLQAGINPKTGLPIRLGDANDGWRKEAIKQTLRTLDEQNAVNRYTWYNIPCNVSSQEIERMLYYRGQLVFFYFKELDSFFFMPYTLAGDSKDAINLDFYGRYKKVHPVPFVQGATSEEKKHYSRQGAYLSNILLDVVYDVPIEEVDLFNSCVLLHDYTKQISQTITPRQLLQDPILDIMSDCIPFMRTNLLNSTGIQGIRVQNTDEQSNVEAASRSIDSASLNGRKYVPIVGQVEFQDLTGGNVAKSEEFMMAMQSLDNYRLGLYGLENGGVFEKKAHVLEAEQQMNAGKVVSPLQDGLAIRQRFCDIVNSIWGIGISCEISDSAVGMDSNLDGFTSDEKDQTGTIPSDQPEV